MHTNVWRADVGSMKGVGQSPLCPLPLSMLPAQLTGAAAIDNCAD